MQEGTEQFERKARGWPYVVTGVAFAGICAWISYNDGLFVARLAGNHDRLAYFYPLLPDGLIVLCLLALAEVSRKDRSLWAVAGLRLGIALTLAMNIYAGWEHSVLDAILDGAVPVVFFIAAEVVLWHVRHGRQPLAPGKASAAAVDKVSSSRMEAAEARLRFALDHGFRYSDNEMRGEWSLTRTEATEVRQKVTADRGRGETPIPMGPGSTPVAERSRGGAPVGGPPAVPAAQAPAGDPPTPAGQDPAGAAYPRRPAPAGAFNGQAHGG